MFLRRFLHFILVLCFCTQFSVIAQDNTAVYVDVSAAPSGDGSKAAPFNTIEAAKEYVRTINKEMTSDIIVNIAKGNYFLSDTLNFTNEDAGYNGHRVIWHGENMPQISGGEPIYGFTPSEYSGIYKAPYDGELVRELYINGKKAYMAASEHTIKAIGMYDDPLTHYETDGMYISKENMGIYENPEDMEFDWQIVWKFVSARVKDLIEDPDDDTRIIAVMEQSWWNQRATLSDESLSAKPYRAFTLKNAFELLDCPGEFYFNRKEKVIYYMPRPDEDLSNAEVIVPKIDKIMNVDGNDYDDRVKNITFDGIKFAHSTFYAPAEGGIETSQQQGFTRTNDLPVYMPAAIQLSRTDGIEFTDSYFFGFGAAGIDIKDAVDNTIIDRCSFSDIGDAAVFIGRISHGGRDTTYESVMKHPPENAGSFNLINGSEKHATSYYLDMEVLAGSINYIENDSYPYSRTWHSDPYAPSNGEKSWVRYDFEDRYTLSEIRLAFDPNNSTPEERSGYEVLLSNDRYFKDYKTVAVQQQPAGEYEVYTPDTEDKYRYLMIRTTSPKSMALSGVWALTNDRKPYTDSVPTRNNTISNSYVTRVGETICSGGGISAFYTKGLNVLHNEISYIPYSGVMIGWGWHYEAFGSGDNHVAYNYIHDTNRTLNDGGGIYTLSYQDGTVVENNYVKSPFVGKCSYYSDNGSKDILWRNNVSEDSVLSHQLAAEDIRSNTIIGTFSTTGRYLNRSLYSHFEEPEIFLPGIPPEKAKRIIDEAGVPKQYSYVKERVYAAPLHVSEKRAVLESLGSEPQLRAMLEDVVQTMLKKGSFGVDRGEYPIKYKYMLEKALEGTKTEKKKFPALLKLREVINEAAENVIQQEHTLTDGDYELAYLYVDGMSDVKINKADLTVTLTMPENIDLSNRKAELTIVGDAKSAVGSDSIDLSKGFGRLPIYKTADKSYDLWTVNVVYAKDGMWTNCDTDGGIINEYSDGQILIGTHTTPYIRQNSEKSLVFTPMSYNAQNSFSLIFAASTAEGFEGITDGEKDNHLRIEVKNDKAQLVMHSGGAETVIKNFDFPVEYRQKNTLEIKTKQERNMTKCEIYLNRNKCTDVLLSGDVSGGYMGVWNKTFSVKVEK